MAKILHHGLCSYTFEPKFVGTDYFTFFHNPCEDKPPYHGHCDVYAVLIDNSGRIIFNLKCKTCGFTDALKTHPLLWNVEDGKHWIQKQALGRFHLSPKLIKRCKTHWWDNV